MNPRLIQLTTKHSFEDKRAKKKEGTCKAYKSMLNKFEKFCINSLDDHFESLIDDLLILKKENSELVKLGYPSKLMTTSLLVWIRKNNFPKGFQILCMNCNWGKGNSKDNKCPHEKNH